MAQYNRPPKVKLKGPDEFVSAMDHVVRYFLKHQNKFYLLVLAALLGLAGVGIYNWSISKKLSAVAVQYTEAEKAPAGEALGFWEKVLQEKPPRGVSHLAHFQIGGIRAGENKWNEAGQSFLQGAESRDPTLGAVGSLAAAISLENGGDCTKALPLYEGISGREKDPFRYDAQLGMARCYLATNRANDAETILFQLISNQSAASPGVKSAALNELISSKL